MDRRLTPKLAVLSLSLGLVLAVFPVTASDYWTVTGSPSGGWVSQVIVDPGTPATLYAVSGSGVYKSTDSGAHWAVVLSSLDAPSALAMDPQHSQTLYAGYSPSEGIPSILKTTDGGATWKESDTGIGLVEDDTEMDGIDGLTIDPTNSNIVYAQSMNTGTYKSTDGGQSWTAIDTGIENLEHDLGHQYPVTIDPANPQVLFFGAQVSPPNGGLFSADSRSGLYRSTDGGASWTEVMTSVGIAHVVVDPADDQVVYAGGPGLYKSTDNGVTWTQQASSPVLDVISIDPTDSLRMWGVSALGTLNQTTDGGSTWNAVNIGAGIQPFWDSPIVVDPSTPTNLYAATYWGVFSSTDDGATWNFLPTGIHNISVNLMLEGADGVVYLASDSNGIYKSADQGATWAEVGNGGNVTGSLPTAGDSVQALVQDPTANSTLYAGTTGGIYKTIDGGDTWTETDSGVPNHGYVLGLTMDPEVPTTLYAATSIDGVGVYKSIDGGTTWNPAGNGLTMDVTQGGFQALAVDPHNSNVVYAGAFYSGLFKSTDGGASWQPDNGAIGVTDIWGIAVDPKDSNIVYTATSNGFFKSTDAGATWVESDYGLFGYWQMDEIVVDPNDTQIIYGVERFGLGTFVSPDAGYTWYNLSDISSSTQAMSQFTRSRINRSISPGMHGRVTRSSSPQWTISAAAMGPANPGKILGGANDGRIYTFDVKNLPKGRRVASGGGGGTIVGSSSGSSSGGGGSLSLLVLLGLTGFAARRRR